MGGEPNILIQALMVIALYWGAGFLVSNNPVIQLLIAVFGRTLLVAIWQSRPGPTIGLDGTISATKQPTRIHVIIIIVVIAMLVLIVARFPAATSNSVLPPAYAGTRLGSVPKGDRELWAYAGEAGEIVSIVTNADITPTLNLLDTRLIVRAPDGTVLAENGNPSFLDTNARVDDLELPDSGQYEIEVRGESDMFGGLYTLTINTSRITVDLQPTDAVSYYYRGTAYIQAQRYAEGIADFERALELDRELIDVYLVLGLMYGETGNRDKALDTLNEYMRLAGDRTLPLVPTAIAFFDMPIATPIMQDEHARLGENRGQLVVGGAQVWLYEGSAGQIVTIQVIADQPASGANEQERQEQNLLDPHLIFRAPDGTYLMSSDDIVVFQNTDSRIEDLALPQDGMYEIEVRSSGNATGGDYTLTIESVDISTEDAAQ